MDRQPDTAHIVESSAIAIRHAIAVDDAGRIFDPANGAPEPGQFTIEQCITGRSFKIQSCFIVRDRRLM
jgi:hypothetical protein